jgi:OHCU decarboxylase
MAEFPALEFGGKSMGINLEELNQLPLKKAKAEFLKSCGSQEWAEKMSAARPFSNLENLLKAAEEIWKGLQPHDWLEAFSQHPRIGERLTDKQAKEEQSGVNSASDQTLKALFEGNQTYERKFQHVFLVCATGKSGDEMLQSLKSRLGNNSEAELNYAAGEQLKITKIRLQKMLSA